jgi:hypothetical protein
LNIPKNYCCGSGVCIINEKGECWCGQAWDGEKMAPAPLKPLSHDESSPQEKTSQIKP